MEVATLDEVVKAISSVGFPIVMCGVLFWYIYKVESKLTEAINSLTIVITEIKTTLGNRGDDFK